MNKIYIDTCIVIYYVEGSKGTQQQIIQDLGTLSSTRSTVVVTDLTRLECRIKPLRDNDTELLTDYDRFFALPEIQKQDFTAEIFDRAAMLRAEHNLKTADALHFAAALASDCSVFWTNDLRLKAVQHLLPIQIL